MKSEALAPIPVPRYPGDLMVQGLAALRTLTSGDSAVTSAALERYAAVKVPTDSVLEGAKRVDLALAVDVLRNSKPVPALMVVTDWTVLVIPQGRRRATPLMLPRISLHVAIADHGHGPVIDLHADGQRVQIRLPEGDQLQQEVLRLLYRVPTATTKK